jgi:S1-C subfamily serine protease
VVPVPAALLALLAVVAAPGPGAAAPAPVAADGAVLALRGGGWHGSALVWSRGAGEGRLLTALHVVEEMPAVEARLPSGEWVPARIVDRDPALDLALLAVAAGGLPAPRPLAGPARAGDPAWIAGCPELRCGVTPARVATPELAFAGSRYVELRGEARPGASGGAALDASGALVGVVDLALRRPVATALAIPAARAAARFPRGELVAAAGAGRPRPGL